MNINKDTVKDFASKLKVAFAAFETKVKFVAAKLADGNEINIQADALAAGVVVTTMTDAGEAPLPDGEYTLEDGTVFVISGGSVAEVKQPAATEEEGMAAQAPANGAPAPAAPNPTQIIERIEKEMLFEKVAKIDDLEKTLAAFTEKFAALESENKSLKEVNVKFESVISSMNEALEAFGEQPQEEAPKKVEPAEVKKETIEEFRARTFK